MHRPVMPVRRGRLRTALVLAAMTLAPTTLTWADPADDSEAARLDPDYGAGKTAVDAKDWRAAVVAFSAAAQRNPGNADIQNALGFAYRNAGQLDLAFKHYERALQLDPRHRGAHEYIGEAYLMANDLAKAEEHLGILRKLCAIPCEEYVDLEKAIAAYRQRTGR